MTINLHQGHLLLLLDAMSGTIKCVLNLQTMMRKKAAESPFYACIHTNLIEARGRPLIVAKRWRCSWPDNASQRISNYKKYKIQEKVRHFFSEPFLFKTMSILILLKTCSKLEMHRHKERERERERGHLGTDSNSSSNVWHANWASDWMTINQCC